MRLIDADALMQKLANMIAWRGKRDGAAMYFQIGDAIMDFPTIDPESLRERGRWIMQQDNTGVCSNCHRQDHIDPLAKYCRYCGARMCEED